MLHILKKYPFNYNEFWYGLGVGGIVSNIMSSISNKKRRIP